ncbi:very-short-patch-repair endonuclease [Rhodoblastus acidophilus]|uniref:endonuclease domain-containing protein n=1 Tax=Rhodoblastus acidophilus TaxID=1074 RepID=UPI0022251D8D|nr:DUF559 domain-containing protein [Rhodoblastus acidophilus]MCW2315599.1 very-short-patch-repair endonuclease [Rhodoblastus acidophilus]
MRGATPTRTDRSRLLRRDATSAEAKLWQRLRARRLNGFKFVRQENIGVYYVDFVCREAKLIVEVDGATHSTPRERAHDHRRDMWLVEQGFRVLRVTNADVFENIAGVCETILHALLPPTAPTPSPRTRGEGGGEGDAGAGSPGSACGRPDSQD